MTPLYGVGNALLIVFDFVAGAFISTRAYFLDLRGVSSELAQRTSIPFCCLAMMASEALSCAR
jgi:hypothetical protein